MCLLKKAKGRDMLQYKRRSTLQNGGRPQAGVFRQGPTSTTTTVSVKTSPAVQPDFVLYVQPRCKKSQSLVGIVESSGIRPPLIMIQDVRILSVLPEWLHTTPVCADARLGLIYKGDDAVTVVERLCRMKQDPDQRMEASSLPLVSENQGQDALGSTTHQPHRTAVDRKKGVMDELFTLEEEPVSGRTPQRATRGTGKLSEMDLQEYQTLRERQGVARSGQRV
eukprot:jgi/Bigna1/136854/aug1.36_g11562